MGSGCATIEMMRHTLLLLLGVTVVDIEGQSVVFPSNTEDAVVIEPVGHRGKVPSLPLRWKRLNRLKNIWSERTNNRTRAEIIGMVKPMDNEVEWGTDIFGTMEKGNLCGDGSTYCARPSHYPKTAIARALKNNKKRYLVQVDIDLAEFSGLVRTVQTVECLGSQLDGERESCGVLPGRRTECRQEYTEHRMVALDMERGELVDEAFNFPSCCSCMVHRGFELWPTPRLCWTPKLAISRRYQSILLPFSIKPYAIQRHMNLSS